MKNREQFIDKLVEDLNAEIKSFEEYAESEDSPHAEYCATIGYGEDKATLEYLSDEAKELVKLIPKGRRREAFQECSDLKMVGVFSEDNEVYRTMLGELEHQIDGEILERVKSLNEAEFAEVRKRIDAYMHERYRDLLYTNHDYQGWVLILDENRLRDWLKDNGVELAKENEAANE